MRDSSEKKGAKTCESPRCIMSTPFGFATYLLGLWVIMFVEWPYNLLGILTVGAGFAYTLFISKGFR